MISRIVMIAAAMAGASWPAVASPGEQPAARPSHADVRPLSRPGGRRGLPALAATGVLPPPRPDLDAAPLESGGAKRPDPAAAAEPEVRAGLVRQAGHADPLPPARPLFPSTAAAFATLPAPTPEPAPPEPPAPVAPSLFAALFTPRPAQVSIEEPAAAASSPGRARLDQLIATHARLNGVPEALVHRIVVRESRYNPRAVGRGGAMGLMQIKTATARGMGYEGGPAGLLDAETNITYAVKYLAGAYRTAGGDFNRAVGYYAGGYYYAAKRQGVGQTPARRPSRTEPELGIAPPPPAAAPVLAFAPEDRATR